MHALLTVRRLKPGTYDDWRKAWEPDEWPEGAQKAYILRNVDDSDEIIAFGFYEGDLTQRRAEPAMQEMQRVRFDRMAPYVDSTGADGVYEGDRGGAAELGSPRSASLRVVSVVRLSRPEARRIAVRAQLLDARRPTDLLAVVKHLTFLQVDPTAAIAPAADLVAWSRLGSLYQPDHLKQALEKDRTLFEHNALVRPMSDVGLYLSGAVGPRSGGRADAWIGDNESFRRDILDRLADSGPLTSRDIPDTSVVPWASSGWTNDRNVTQMLEFLMMRGEVAITGRVGRERLWDVAERVYPADVDVPPVEEAQRIKNERRLRSLGIARVKSTPQPIEPVDVGDAGVPAVVEGVAGEWRVDPAALDQDFEGRTALLSPFDRLVYDRVRAQELFDFEYVLEMYKPKEKRRWGYFALPVLHEDRLVGKVDATADRKRSVLEVHAVHEDVRFTPAMRQAVHAEVEEMASWLGLEVVVL